MSSKLLYSLNKEIEGIWTNGFECVIVYNHRMASRENLTDGVDIILKEIPTIEAVELEETSVHIHWDLTNRLG